MNTLNLTLYDHIPVHDLLMRGRFLARNYLSKDELCLGLSYLKSAVFKGNLEAAEAMIEVCENDWLNIHNYDKLVEETAFQAVLSCENSDSGISFLEKLLTYGTHEKAIYALNVLKKKEKGCDSVCTETRIRIAEYTLTGKDPKEMLEACRKNLDCYAIRKFYYLYFCPWPKNRDHFDYMTPEDAKILFSDLYRRHQDPDLLLAMIRDSYSPYRDEILSEYFRKEAEAEERSRELEKRYNISKEQLRAILSDWTVQLPQDFSDEEEN